MIVAAAEEPVPEEEFGEVLLDAVAASGLRRRDAALIYATRVRSATATSTNPGSSQRSGRQACRRA